MARDQTKRHGRHQQIHWRAWRTDKNNLTTGAIEFHREEAFDKPSFEYLGLRSGPRLSGVSRLVSGVSCVGAERTYDEKMQMAIYTYSFEGLGTSDFEPLEQPTFELDFTMREEPIETHPAFEKLARDYFWNYERKEFARNIPQDSSKAGLASANDPTKRATNPMYGVTSYLVPGVVYRRSYTSTYLPNYVVNGIGTIVVPPGIANFSSLLDILGGGRNWLKLAPKVQQRGTAVSVSEEYLLSGPRGVLRQVYDRAVLES